MALGAPEIETCLGSFRKSYPLKLVSKSTDSQCKTASYKIPPCRGLGNGNTLLHVTLMLTLNKTNTARKMQTLQHRFLICIKKSLCKGNFWAARQLFRRGGNEDRAVSLPLLEKGVIPWHGWEQLYPDAARFLQARRDVNIHTRTQIPLFHNMNSDALFSTWPKKKKP